MSRSHPLPDDLVAELVNQLVDGELILFVGAGFSRLATDADGRRLPLWSELADAAGTFFQKENAHFNNDPLELFDAIEKLHGRDVLYRFLREILSHKGLKFPAAVQDFVQLPWRKIVTTNYDGLVSNILGETSPIIDEIGHRDLSRSRLIHLHGSLTVNPHTVTREDYIRWFDRHPIACHNLQEFALHHRLLFAGYSMSDPHIIDILHQVLNWTGKARKHYALFWKLHEDRCHIIRDRDNIVAFSIETLEEWEYAFRQIQQAYEASRKTSERLDAAKPKISSSTKTFAITDTLKTDSHPRIPIFQIHKTTEDGRFTGRMEQQQHLDLLAGNRDIRVISIISMGGNGKTALIGHWLKDQERLCSLRPFQGIFVWSFYYGNKQDDFIASLIGFLTENLHIEAPPPHYDKVEWLLDTLDAHEIALFLDGIEVLQDYGNPHGPSELSQGDLRRFVRQFCAVGRNSLMLITSRLALKDLSPYAPLRHAQLNLPGLIAEDGMALFAKLRVDATEMHKQNYVEQFEGHPLGLRVFALILKRSPLGFGNAAAKLAEEIRLDAFDSLEAKLKRTLAAYQSRLDTVDVDLLRALAVFPDAQPAEIVIRLLEEQIPERVRQLGAARLAFRLEDLARDGVLEVGGLQHTYSFHPLFREHFRPQGNDLARPGARLLLEGRPENFLPKTLEEAKPYLQAIAMLTGIGDFKTANTILGKNLEWSAKLKEIEAYPEALDCLMGFFADHQRDNCLAALGEQWYREMLFHLLDILITLEEWEQAEKYLAIEEGFARLQDERDRYDCALRRARIATEVGSPQLARESYREILKLCNPPTSLNLEVAEVERSFGYRARSVELIREWVGAGPGNSNLTEWLYGWREVCYTMGYCLSQINPIESVRYWRGFAALEEEIQGKGGLGNMALQEIARIEQDWERCLEISRNFFISHKAKKWNGNAAGWRIGIAKALNHLGRPHEALAELKRAQAEINPGHWRQIWIRIEIFRAKLLLGDAKFVLLGTRQTISDAKRSERWILVRDAAKIMLDAARASNDPESLKEAETELDHCQNISGLCLGYKPDLGPLPGESGWNEYVTGLLLAGLGETARAPQNAQEAFVRAAELGLLNVLVSLLAQGVPLDARDLAGQTALEVAARAGQSKAVRWLLDQGIHHSMDGTVYQAALGYAVERGHESVAVLLAEQADKLAQEDWPILFRAAAQKGYVQLTETLLAKGLFIDQTDSGSHHPMVLAARAGHLPVIKCWASHLRQVDVRGNIDEQTPLLAAAGAGFAHIVEFLLDHHADPGLIDAQGLTALDAALTGGHIGAARLLLKHKGQTSLSTAKSHHAFVDAASLNKVDTMRFLHSEGAPLAGPDDRGTCALVRAAAGGAEEAVRFLLEQGVSVEDCEVDGETALMAAVYGGRDAIVRLLHENRADFAAKDLQNRSVGSYAMFGGQASTVRLLLDFGMQIDWADDRFLEAINVAARESHGEALFEVLRGIPLPGILAALDWPASEAVDSVEALVDKMIRSARRRIALPTQPPTSLSDNELEHQLCVVAMAGCRTFARLPLIPADANILARFEMEKWFDSIEEFDFTQLMQADLPFLAGWRLILLPHRQGGFAVPLVMAEGQLALVRTQNDWLYSLMQAISTERTQEALIAYAHFFFTVIVAQLGSFSIVDDVDHIPWLSSASEDDKSRVQALLTPLRYLGVGVDGRHELRGTMVFRNALFVASVLINRKWETELTKEQLLLEDLPIGHGRAEGLFVRDTSYGPISVLDRSKANKWVLPSRFPDDSNEQDIEAQDHVVALAGCETFARLPLHDLGDVALMERLKLEEWIANVDEFDLERPRVADIPFLPDWQLVLLPHRQGKFAFPLVVGNNRVVVPSTENEWIYSLMETTQADKTPDILMAYANFFFAMVVGQLGAFEIVDSADQILWNASATDADRDRVKPHLSRLRYLGVKPDGCHELRGSIVFKNALFVSSILVTDTWQMELADEELLLEDLPIDFGRNDALGVRY